MRNIEMNFDENLKTGVMFRTPVDSEADEFLSGLIDFKIEGEKMSITTNCMGIAGNPAECLLLIDMAIGEMYRQITGKDIHAPK